MFMTAPYNKLRDSQPNSNTPSGSDCGLFGCESRSLYSVFNLSHSAFNRLCEGLKDSATPAGYSMFMSAPYDKIPTDGQSCQCIS